MNTLIVFALCVAYASASVIGHGTVVSGPSGIVTDHGAIGPVAVGHGLHGLHGAVVSGPAGVVTHQGAIGPVAHHGLGWAGVGNGLGWGGVGHGLGWGGVVAPAVAHSAIVSGHGLGLSHGAVVGHGLAHGAVVGHGLAHGAVLGHHGGVVVKGPHTAPAVIAGPAGKIVADGLWGPTSVWNSHHGW